MRLTVLSFVCTSLVLGTAVARAQRTKRTKRSVEQLLTHKEPLLRESAVQVLGVRGSFSSVPLLLERLKKDDNLWVRARAAEALGKLGAAAAIRPLRSALEREKKQRVRRMIAVALARLGQRSGVEELMWQLKAGTNHAKAEVQAFLVQITGQPLGQDTKAWWAYFSRRGYKLLARRPAGAGALQEISARAFTQAPLPWRVVPAVVITLPKGRRPVTPKVLRALERRRGRIPDGCLLLFRTSDAKKPAAKPKRNMITGPGLTLAAVQYLLERAPKLVGVGIDAPTLDAATPAGPAHAARKHLMDKGRLVLEGVTNLDRLVETGTRVLLVDKGEASSGGRKVQVLAVMP